MLVPKGSLSYTTNITLRHLQYIRFARSIAGTDDPDVVEVGLESSDGLRRVTTAVEVQDHGEIMTPERGRPIEIPPGLGNALDGDPETRAAFDNLTPGRRREFAIMSPKPSETTPRRVASKRLCR